MMASGKAGDPPVRVGLPIADVVAPLFAVMGINAALYERERSGEGEYVDISMLGSLATLLAVEDWRAMERLGMQMRTGSTVPRASPMGCYRCRDGYVAMAAGGRDALALALFQAMGAPELALDPRFCTLTARMRNDDELTRLIEAWCGDRGADDVERQLVAAGIPAAKVLSPADALDEPVLRERREIVDTIHPSKEIAQHKVRVNCIAVSVIDDTAVGDAINDGAPPWDERAKRYAKVRERAPFGLAQTSDIASVAAFLLSDSARFITGSTVSPTGGLTYS